jgi:hypothetical protein
MTIARPFEIGAFTFGEITADPITRRPIDPAVRLREFIDLAVLADQAGLDVFGAGEHHRPDVAIASPPVVLAAIAQATERSRLTSTHRSGSTTCATPTQPCSSRPACRSRSSPNGSATRHLGSRWRLTNTSSQGCNTKPHSPSRSSYATLPDGTSPRRLLHPPTSTR